VQIILNDAHVKEVKDLETGAILRPFTSYKELINVDYESSTGWAFDRVLWVRTKHSITITLNQ